MRRLGLFPCESFRQMVATRYGPNPFTPALYRTAVSRTLGGGGGLVGTPAWLPVSVLLQRRCLPATLAGIGGPGTGGDPIQRRRRGAGTGRPLAPPIGTRALLRLRLLGSLGCPPATAGGYRLGTLRGTWFYALCTCHVAGRAGCQPLRLLSARPPLRPGRGSGPGDARRLFPLAPGQ